MKKVKVLKTLMNKIDCVCVCVCVCVCMYAYQTAYLGKYPSTLKFKALCLNSFCLENGYISQNFKIPKT